MVLHGKYSLEAVASEHQNIAAMKANIATALFYIILCLHRLLLFLTSSYWVCDEDADSLLLPSCAIFCFLIFSFFLLHLSHQNVRWLLLPGNKRDRIELQRRMITVRDRLLFSEIWPTLAHQTFSQRPPICYSNRLLIALSVCHSKPMTLWHHSCCAGDDEWESRILNAYRVSIH